MKELLLNIYPIYMILICWGIWCILSFKRNKKFNELLKIDYPENNINRKARKRIRLYLKQFNEDFYQDQPVDIQKKTTAILESYPRRMSQMQGIERFMREYYDMRLKKKTINSIREVLQIKLILERQIDYFNNELRKNQETKELIENKEYLALFPELYTRRQEVLARIESNLQCIVGCLMDEREHCKKEISSLTELKRTSFFEKIGILASKNKKEKHSSSENDNQDVFADQSNYIFELKGENSLEINYKDLEGFREIREIGIV